MFQISVYHLFKLFLFSINNSRVTLKMNAGQVEHWYIFLKGGFQFLGLVVIQFYFL